MQPEPSIYYYKLFSTTIIMISCKINNEFPYKVKSKIRLLKAIIFLKVLLKQLKLLVSIYATPPTFKIYIVYIII